MARKKGGKVAKVSRKASAGKVKGTRANAAIVRGKRTTVKDAHDKYANQ